MLTVIFLKREQPTCYLAGGRTNADYTVLSFCLRCPKSAGKIESKGAKKYVWSPWQRCSITLHTLSLACPHLRSSSTPGSCISAISITAFTFSFPGTVCPCAVDSRQWKARTPWHPDAGTKPTSGSPTLGARGANFSFAGDLGMSQSRAGQFLNKLLAKCPVALSAELRVQPP